MMLALVFFLQEMIIQSSQKSWEKALQEKKKRAFSFAAQQKAFVLLQIKSKA